MISEITKFLARIRRVTTVLVKFHDTTTMNLLKEYVVTLEGMLAAIKKGGSADALKSEYSNIQNDCLSADDHSLPPELPKALRDALEKLATEEDIQIINQLVRASLENITGDNTEAFDLDPDDQIDLTDWKEGVEDLNQLSEDELWKRLGLPDQRLPFFQQWTDPDSLISPWSEEGQAWLKNESSARQPLRPRWHQLVGILRMLERAFDGQPVLLMDGVGLGKTLQALGAIACLAYYRECFKSMGHFPGMFGE